MAQILVPIADQATGSWTTTPLWLKVDDDSTVNATGDGTTITSANNSAPDDADFQLTTTASDPDTGNHILRARWNKSASGGHAINAVLELYQGVPGTGTLVATLSVTGISETEQESTYTLTGTEVGNITDYQSLYLRLSRQGDTGGAPSGRRSLVADLVEFEIPDAAAAPKEGTGSGSIAVTSTAVGTRVGTGSGSGAVVVSSTASGTPTRKGQASGSVAVTSTADGTPTRKATASGDVVVTSTASGQIASGTQQGSGSGSVAVTSSASGVRIGQGQASGSIVATSTATGQRTALETASGSISVTSTASGTVQGVKQGSGSGSITVTGSATGERTATGTASGDITVTGTASGEVQGAQTGQGSGNVTVTATATGQRIATGTAAGTLEVSTTATGQATHFGTAAGNIIITASASGRYVADVPFTRRREAHPMHPAGREFSRSRDGGP